jgi:hypothetical protein
MARPWTRQLPNSAGSLRSSKALFRHRETSTATKGYCGVSASGKGWSFAAGGVLVAESLAHCAYLIPIASPAPS